VILNREGGTGPIAGSGLREYTAVYLLPAIKHRFPYPFDPMPKQTYLRRRNAARAIAAALLFAAVLLSTTILPHRHPGDRFGASNAKSAGIQEVSGPCPLCDWLATPRVLSPPPSLSFTVPVTLRRVPDPSRIVRVATSGEPLRTPQRGPPAAMSSAPA
jgi:hypothetical protein